MMITPKGERNIETHVNKLKTPTVWNFTIKEHLQKF